MEITGNDYVIYSSVDINSIEENFINKIKQKWENPIIEIERNNERIEFYFSRDQKMEIFSDANAFSLDENGEGIFLLIANLVNTFKSKVEIVEEKYAEIRESEIGNPDPYESFLFFKNVWRYTLVLPSKLEESMFSKEIYGYLISVIDSHLKSL